MNLSSMRRRVLAALAASTLLLAPQVRVGHADSLARLYQITDLGTLSGTISSAGFGINFRGQVTGNATDAAGVSHAFLWQDGVMRDLGTLAGSAPGFTSYGQAIGISGAVTGGSDTPQSFHAFLYRNGTMADLGTLGGDTSYGVGVNLFQQVAGFSNIATLDPTNPGNQELRAFLWRNGTMADLGTLGTGTDSAAGALNDFGQVAGWSTIDTGFDPEAFGPDFHAFLSQRGAMSDLGTLPGGNYSQAYGLNDRGQVVGFAETATVDPMDASCGNPSTFHELHAALWQRRAVADLSPFPGDPDSIAFGTNNWGQVVGRSGTACHSTGAALWQHGTVTDLNTLIPAASGWFLLRARSINDRGQITGEGVSPNGETHAYLLTPAGYGPPHAVDQQAETGRARGTQVQSAPDQSDFRHDLRPPHHALHG